MIQLETLRLLKEIKDNLKVSNKKMRSRENEGGNNEGNQNQDGNKKQASVQT